MRSIAVEKLETLSVGCLSRCNTKRKAVFSPIPGSFVKDATASAINFEGNCIMIMNTKIFNYN
jgi:uncharacterized protein YuzB (UPF0349 family)